MHSYLLTAGLILDELSNTRNDSSDDDDEAAPDLSFFEGGFED